MKKDEAIQILDTIPTIGEQVDALEMAIKALEQQPCEDAISRQAVEEITWEVPSYTDALNVLTEVRDKIRALPSVTPELIKGQWLEVIDDTDSSGCKKNWHYKCSICGNEDSGWGEHNYCPICGAEMEGM